MADVLPFTPPTDFTELLKVAFEELPGAPPGAPDLVAALRADMVTVAEQNLKLQRDVRTLAAIVATLTGGGFPHANARKVALRAAIEIADETHRGPNKSR